MNDLRDAAQQALEAWDGGDVKWFANGYQVMDALRAALTEEALQRLTDANQEIESMIVDEGCFERGCACHDSRESPGVVVVKQPEQEPVAWMVYTLDGKSVCVTDNPADFTDKHRVLPLFTAPPQRKPLDDLAIADIYAKWDATPGVSMADFARAVEAAHGIKEGT